jgi:hypothetical protein
LKGNMQNILVAMYIITRSYILMTLMWMSSILKEEVRDNINLVQINLVLPVLNTKVVMEKDIIWKQRC